MGFEAVVEKHFGGDRRAAVERFVAKGLAALDAHYPPELRKWHDPDEGVQQ